VKIPILSTPIRRPCTVIRPAGNSLEGADESGS
jgi:hypothetical protein